MDHCSSIKNTFFKQNLEVTRHKGTDNGPVSHSQSDRRPEMRSQSPGHTHPMRSLEDDGIPDRSPPEEDEGTQRLQDDTLPPGVNEPNSVSDQERSESMAAIYCE